MTRPYMLSVGVGLPLFGVWMHRYFHVRSPHPLRSASFLGFHIVWTTYRRVDIPPEGM